MEQEQLYEALDGLFAYDTGCTDSGIKNEQLRSNVIFYLKGLGEEQFRLEMSRFIRESFLSEESLLAGYGIEDVKSFIEWLGLRMEIYL